ncbi:MAG TPA: asparagine synthase-related protein [Candidatus Limnocylindrales bacterium]|nr:asparagine synthase-related protein [Candidatus Limnocylindrales bacterium]
MRAHVAVVLTSPGRSEALAPEAVRALARVALPVALESLTQRSWVSPSGELGMWSWSNEDGVEGDPSWWADRDMAVAVSGYLGTADVRPLDVIGGPAAIGRALAHAGGVYAACATSGATRSVVAWNTLPRVEPVFWQEAGDRIAIGNRPLLVHLVATQATKPAYHVPNLLPFLNTGYFASEETPFDGLHVLPPASEIAATSGGVAIRTREAADPATDDSHADTLDALIAACEPIKRAGREVTCNLTGGRDSRLLVAAARAAGVPFRTSTKGHPTHPDVFLAARVAATLGVEHTSTPVSETLRSHVTVDIRERTRLALRTTDGMLSPYENIPSQSGGFESRVVVNGGGGELLRGGYVKLVRPLDRDTAARFLHGLLTSARRFLRADVAASYGDYVERTTAFLPGESPAEALDRIYLALRTGRWAATTRTANAAAYRFFQPLFDARVIDAGRRVDLEQRADERLVFELLRRLDRRLVEIPLAGSPWLFEGERPPGSPASSRASRSAAVTLTSGGVVEWRRTTAGPLDAAMRERLLDSGSAVFDLADRDAVSTALSRGRLSRAGLGIRPSAEAQFLWALYGAQTLLSDEWLAPAAGPAPVAVRVTPSVADRVVARALPLVRSARAAAASVRRSR